ncbi:MAG: ATP synthase F1 subunit gamma [Patescibacteria group bacterium]
MAKTKEISRRIKSVSSTKKITKAMEMVAASKMKKAIDAVLKTRRYAGLSWEMVWHLAKLNKNSSESLHPLLTPRLEIKKVGVILITANRGLCGGYNTAVINKSKEIFKNRNFQVDFILAGKKGASIHNQGHNIAAEFEKGELITETAEIYPIVKMVLTDYQDGKYDQIFVAYTDFINPVKQIPRVKQLLPVEAGAADENLGNASNQAADDKTDSRKSPNNQEIPDAKKNSGEVINEYIFEPSPTEVLDLLIPRLLEVQLYQAFLEANASEHSARMTAMHQATEAADDMVSELTLFYNKARQAAITGEIAEISAGANALAE